ncbi:MAG: hypothetical protein EBU52_18995 [Cytophagia bacterium]|nr:hypothetical protein [Cytophagia bacterium]
MKNALLLFAALFLLSASCHDEKLSTAKNCVPVKLLRSICGSAVFKIQDSRFYHYGESVGGEENVFMAMLECATVQPTNTEAAQDEPEIFYAEIDPDNFQSDCIQCMAIVNYQGEKQYKIRLHQVCNTTSTEE